MKAYIKDLGRVSLVAKGEYDSSSEYERLDLVYDRTTRLAYIARKDVPKGINLDDKEYWQLVSISVDYIEKWIAISNEEIINIVK